MKRAHGFTLIELVVTITISTIVVVFVAMFVAAPVSAFDAQSRRTKLVEGSLDAWPWMERDLRAALPNSVRVRLNGNYVALEMLNVTDAARFMEATSAPFKVAGSVRGVISPATATFNNVYLSVGNPGFGPDDAYKLSGSMMLAVNLGIAGLAGDENRLTPTPAANFSASALANSPKHWAYVVSGPVTYLCDQTLGTIRRYDGYSVTAVQSATPGNFAAAASNRLVAQGITSCNFQATVPSGGRQQTTAVRLVSTNAAGDSVTLLHTYRGEYVP